jgi:hypothetical protein
LGRNWSVRFAVPRCDAGFAAGRSAAMLRRSASIRLTTFSAEGLTGTWGGTLCLLLAKDAHQGIAVVILHHRGRRAQKPEAFEVEIIAS